jgi:hypothetical protein
MRTLDVDAGRRLVLPRFGPKKQNSALREDGETLNPAKMARLGIL